MGEGVIEYISNNILLYGFISQFLAAIFSIYFVPTIRKLALAKKITDIPSARKSHTTEVPVLGGVAVYLAAVFSIFIIIYLFPVKIDSKVFILLGLGSTVLLFAGLLDDIVGLKVSQRFIIQALVTFVVVFKATIFITSMNGLFGVHELSKISSLILSIFVYVIFTNILNLIDGIDGLAAGVSILAFFFFASVAYISGNYLNILISMVSLGSLIPFLYFNILSKKKIFLGDNGSLVLGFVLGYFTLNLLSETNSFGISLLGDHTILILMCLFSYPLVDTLRVFTIRILSGRSPFLADKNHIHHHLLRLGFSHRKATLFVLLFTISITSLSFFLTRININIAFVVLFFLAVFVICLPSFLIKKDEGLILKKKHDLALC